MPLLETKGAASAQGFGLTLGGAERVFIEDVFSTFLYTGNGGTQTITNGIDLSTKGGLVWVKARTNTQSPMLQDSNRGATFSISSDSGTGQIDRTTFGVQSFTASGFSIGDGGGWNQSSIPYASWTFRKQPKFFDVVTYTGNGASNRQIAHGLGSTPGCVIVKCTSTSASWAVWHRSIGSNEYLYLDSTGAVATDNSIFGGSPTATNFTVAGGGAHVATNQNGASYVAYLFAHDAGGFGLSGTDNVISCGSLTSGGTVNLGWEPQWVLCRWSNAASNWTLVDNMRGMPVGSSDAELYANLSNAETLNNVIEISSTGFTAPSAWWGSTNTIIYIAIRRGPMRVPTSGTSVFAPTTRAGTGATATVNTGILTDAVWETGRSGQTNFAYDRLRGVAKQMTFTSTNGESTYTPTDTLTGFDFMTGFVVGADTSNYINSSGINYIYWNFRRAPGFFDVVCYTGTGANRTVTHNLGVVPELMIVKRRDATGGWRVYSSALLNTEVLALQTNDAKSSNTAVWNSTTPTASVFTVGTDTWVNDVSSTYVAYLFASCPGVSKVGSYTGTGSTLQINCGFTGGARFVLIKRTDVNGDWYVWDTARGIVAGNDPYLLLNSTAAEATTTDWVDTFSSGFELSNVGGNNVNINTATYIYLAIA